MWEWRGGEAEGNTKTGLFCGSGEVEREREILKQVSFVGVEWRGKEGEGDTKTG